MIWLLENELFDNLDELKREIVEQGHKYITAKYVPFGGGIELEGSDVLPEQMFCYGSLQFIKTIQRMGEGWRWHNHEFITWCDLPQFKCSYYYPRLSKYLLNRDCMFLPFGQLADAGDFIFDKFGTKIFMRPDSGFKQFTGQIYSQEYWDGFLRVSNIALQPEDLVVISSPKEIFKEYRVIVGPSKDVERQKVITLSQTHSLGKLDERAPSSIFEYMDVAFYAQKVLDDICFEPDPFWVMDVCRDAFGQLKVLEVNSMSCSGYYKCDMSLIVKAVAEYF